VNQSQSATRRGHEAIIQAFKDRAHTVRFIPFVMGGDPTLQATEKHVWDLARLGATVIEIGVPYSDPLADGPVIQEAALRALHSGTTVRRLFDLVARMRANGLTIPIVLLVYVNTVLRYGIDSFFKSARDSGVDGLIIPDLPWEEMAPFRQSETLTGVSIIPLVTLTSVERLPEVLKDRLGFVYVVSSLGVTGTREALDDRLVSFLQEVRTYTDLPVAVGFGISHQNHIDALAGHADAVIIGSHLIAHLAAGRTVDDWYHSLFKTT